MFPVKRQLLCEDTEGAHFLLSLASYTRPRSKVNCVHEQWPNCSAAPYSSGGGNSHMPGPGTTAVLAALNTFACLRTVLVAPLVALALPPSPKTLLACLLPDCVANAEPLLPSLNTASDVTHVCENLPHQWPCATVLSSVPNWIAKGHLRSTECVMHTLLRTA